MASIRTAMPTDPNSTAQNFGGVSRMAGTDSDVDSTSQSADSGQGQADPQRALANMIQTIRQCEEQLMSVAGNNPQLAKEVRDARSALRAVIKRAVSNPGGSEPPAPRTRF
jgi:hypothetical protein